METVTLSSKGQCIIPKSIRLDAQLTAGTELEISWIDGEIRLRPLAKQQTTQLSKVSGCLYRSERKRLSDADTQAAIKQQLKKRHAP
jgi:AbrB family looped-hinge helix DNA binding protein